MIVKLHEFEQYEETLKGLAPCLTIDASNDYRMRDAMVFISGGDTLDGALTRLKDAAETVSKLTGICERMKEAGYSHTMSHSKDGMIRFEKVGQ